MGAGIVNIGGGGGTANLSGGELEYLMHMQDIAKNNAFSYIFEAWNKPAFHDMLKNSTYIFTSNEIKNTLYNVLKDEDVDVFIENNENFGYCINGTYDKTIFSQGGG